MLRHYQNGSIRVDKFSEATISESEKIIILYYQHDSTIKLKLKI